MTLQEQSNLVLAFAKVLFVNGESTYETIIATEQVSGSLGLHATIIPRWGELELKTKDETEELVSVVRADPTGVDMTRVASIWKTIDALREGKLNSSDAFDEITTISHAGPAPTWLFTLAAAAGAVALSVIFGVHHFSSVAIIAGSGAAGAVLRRILARYSTNALLQPFCAALAAGIVGAIAVRLELSSPLRLIAVCPCLILVPGPHVLKGMIDLMATRVSLGASRLFFSSLVILAICVGLRLYSDTADRGRFVETYVVESWGEHLRQHTRTTEADRQIEERVSTFQLKGAHKTTHFIAEHV